MARNLQTIARDLKAASNLIVNFTFPKISPSEESDFDFLRSATICVDGSLINIYYTKSDYNSHFFETVQIIGEHSPFIPFLVVLKVGKVFLGDGTLTLTEFYQKNRKVYCWNLITNKDGEKFESILIQGEKCNFEGHDYTYISQ